MDRTGHILCSHPLENGQDWTHPLLSPTREWTGWTHPLLISHKRMDRTGHSFALTHKTMDRTGHIFCSHPLENGQDCMTHPLLISHKRRPHPWLSPKDMLDSSQHCHFLIFSSKKQKAPTQEKFIYNIKSFFNVTFSP